MEGPGGYQFVGRTIQMWNRHRQTADFIDGKPWLLRFFDQLRFYPVSAEELLQLREDFPRGKFKLRIEPTTLRLRDYQSFLQANAESIAAFKTRQHAAFEAERERWQASNEIAIASEPMPRAEEGSDTSIPADALGVMAPVSGTVWKLLVEPGQRVSEGTELLLVEAMKMEIPIVAEEAGEIVEVRVAQGSSVNAGEVLMVMRPTRKPE
jgi:urea carboxylase